VGRLVDREHANWRVLHCRPDGDVSTDRHNRRTRRVRSVSWGLGRRVRRTERLPGRVELAYVGAEIVGPDHQTGSVRVAAGDFDGDSFDDLAISVSGLAVGAGTLHVIYGSRARLAGTVLIETVAVLLPDPAVVSPAPASDGDAIDDSCRHEASTRWPADAVVTEAHSLAPSEWTAVADCRTGR
jgi:hypothetical protein